MNLGFSLFIFLVLLLTSVYYGDHFLAQYFGEDLFLTPFFSHITHLGDGLFYLFFLGVAWFWIAFFRPKWNWMKVRNLTSSKALKGIKGLVFFYLSAGVLLFGFKALVGRQRPRFSEMDPFVFKPFSLEPSYHSFPSGHTFSVFYFLGFLALFWGKRPWHYGLLYGLAGLVGFSRVVIGKHFLSDIVAGAFIGLMLSLFTFCFFKKREEKRKAQ